MTKTGNEHSTLIGRSLEGCFVSPARSETRRSVWLEGLGTGKAGGFVTWVGWVAGCTLVFAELLYLFSLVFVVVVVVVLYCFALLFFCFLLLFFFMYATRPPRMPSGKMSVSNAGVLGYTFCFSRPSHTHI